MKRRVHCNYFMKINLFQEVIAKYIQEVRKDKSSIEMDTLISLEHLNMLSPK